MPTPTALAAALRSEPHRVAPGVALEVAAELERLYEMAVSDRNALIAVEKLNASQASEIERLREALRKVRGWREIGRDDRMAAIEEICDEAIASEIERDFAQDVMSPPDGAIELGFQGDNDASDEQPTARAIATRFHRSTATVDDIELVILRYLEHHLDHDRIRQERDHYKELWEASQSVNVAAMRDAKY